MEPLLFLGRRRLLRNSLCPTCLRHSLRPNKRVAQITLQERSQSHYSNSLAASPRSVQASNEEEIYDEVSGYPQAHPLGNYYSDILKMPSQRPSRKFRPKNFPPEPQESTSPPASELPPDDPKARFGIVFGTRLAGPGYASRYTPDTMPPESTWKTINGVPIPPRPSEPDNCCMSGCVNCVWDDYRDEVEAWAARIQEAQQRQPAASTWSDEAKEKRAAKRKKDVRQQPREEVESASTSMDDDGGPSPTSWGTGLSMDEDDLFSEIPVGIREFMKTEKRLKERRHSERSENSIL